MTCTRRWTTCRTGRTRSRTRWPRGTWPAAPRCCTTRPRLRAPQVKALVRGGDLQLTLFDQTDLAEITSPDFPGERLVACKNPFLEAERARKRESLLAAAEADLGKIAAACARARRPLRGQDKIAVRVDRVLSRRKVAKHFTVDVGEDHLSYARNQDSIAAEAALDGIYVLRTS